MLLRQRVMARSHLPTVAELIREARRKGAAQARLGPSLAIDILYFELLADTSDPRKIGFHNPFLQTREAISHDSLDLFDDFSGNMAPYSIFPFSDEDCSDVMVGAMWLRSYFSYRNLARCLKRRGLSVLLPTDAQMRAYLSLSIGQRRRAAERLGIVVSRPRDARSLLFPLDSTARMWAEFLTEGSFADSVEEALSRDDLFEGHDAPIRFRTGFANESDLWD
jgi:hypothetical protein